jgi:hypothetical protein
MPEVAMSIYRERSSENGAEIKRTRGKQALLSWKV